jgi:DNA-binding response OmpR family regulator
MKSSSHARPKAAASPQKPALGTCGRAANRPRAFTLRQAIVRVTQPRVLLAEDDVEVREYLAAELRRDGYQVIEARDGAELVRHVEALLGDGPEAEQPAIIITDLFMPKVDGLEVLTRLHRAGLETPVIVITGFGDEKTRGAVRRMGAVAVFNKPFDIDELRAAVLDLAQR